MSFALLLSETTAPTLIPVAAKASTLVYFCVMLAGNVTPIESGGVLSHYAPSHEVIIHLADLNDRLKVKMALSDALTRVATELGPKELQRAHAAIREATNLVGRIPVQHEPWVSITDEGLAVLQWQAKNNGVMLLLSGDGVVTVSVTNSKENYSDNAFDYDVGGNASIVIAASVHNLYA